VAESCCVPPTVMVAVDGETETDPTGTGGGVVTVTAEVPVCPSLVAVIVALPAATAVTRPDVDTLAMLVLLELQLITRPVRTLLLASRVVAESCCVPPTMRFAVVGETETEATGTGAGAETVIAEEPVFPSLVAVTEAVPAATAVTRPELDTVATFVLLELQPITRPVRTLLLASRVVAESCCVPPTVRLAVVGETETDPTGTGAGALTVIVEEPVWPSLAAVTEALPAATAVTRPDADTVTMLVLLELQSITRPVRMLLLASRVTADN